MSLAQPLSPRLARLRARLAVHRPVTDDDASLLWAAVAVVLVPSPDAVLLIRRAERSGDPWSGHMALPGGRREDIDLDLIATAVRETWEEVGLTLTHADLLGSLDDVVPRTPVLPPIAVRPYVFSLPERPDSSRTPRSPPRAGRSSTSCCIRTPTGRSISTSEASAANSPRTR